MPHKAMKQRHWSRALAYAFFVLGGLLTLLHPPVSYQETSAAWVPVAWGVLTFVPAIVATLGCVLPRHRWEWVAAWLLAAGVGLYAIAGWGQVMTEGLGHGTRASFMTGAALFFVARARQLARESESARLSIVAREAVSKNDA